MEQLKLRVEPLPLEQEAGSPPAGATKRLHSQRMPRRGLEHNFSISTWAHPAPKSSGRGRYSAMRVLFWACMAIGALSIGAQLTGHAETLRTIWHQSP